MKQQTLSSNRERSRIVLRVEAAYRISVLHTIAKINGSILITEFPKSGGTWLAEMLSEATKVPFPQHQFPGLVGSSVFHGHYANGFDGVPTIVLWRDPRDIVVSWYYHCLTSAHTSSSLVEKTLKDLSFSDVNDIQGNLSMFIEYMFTRQRSPSFSWNQFYDNWIQPDSGIDLVHTSYERLSSNAESELGRIMSCLEITPAAGDAGLSAIVSRHSFQNKTGRNNGKSDSKSFLRKGIVGDWKNHFSGDATEALEKATEGRLAEYEEFHKSIT